MPGRKRREMTEAEKEWEYRQAQRRGRGDHVVGEQAEFLEDRGDAADVRRRRERYAREHEEV